MDLIQKPLSEHEFQELLRCSTSPAYFINNYCKISHPKHGTIPFTLYEFQRRVIHEFLNNPFNIILKARQMGLTWLMAGYQLWMALFFYDKEIMTISMNEKVSYRVLYRVKTMYRNLPHFLKLPVVEDNKSEMRFINNSHIQSIPTSPEAGRSESLSLLCIDECAFVRWIEEIWTAASMTLATGGNAILNSTPNGIGNFYYDTWQKSVAGTAPFNPILIEWDLHPDRDDAWYQRECEKLGSKQRVAQEIDCDFIASGNLVFDSTGLRSIFEHCAETSPLKVFYDTEVDKDFPCGLYQFEESSQNEFYIMGIDPAKGGAGDYHVMHIVAYSTGEQVVEYRSKCLPEDFVKNCATWARKYNNALVAIEDQGGFGQTMLLAFKHLSYRNLYMHRDFLKTQEKSLKKRRKKSVNSSVIPGAFPMTTQTRPICIDTLAQEIKEGTDGVNGIRTASELNSFAWVKTGRAEAQTGSHDDCVMSYAICKTIRQVINPMKSFVSSITR